MAEHESHCPFLNRSDYRCANHFSLDRLERAFDHCFGEYQACPTYREMLSERRSRLPVGEIRLAAAGAAALDSSGSCGLTTTVVYANLTVRTRPAHVTVNARLPEHASAL